MFAKSVCEKLKYYVYRLIDPRNGETFYVGKGQGNRLFDHANGIKITIDGEDEISQKIKRIKQIKAQGHEVIHIIHRHGLDNDTAYEVEAALIDAYPGLTNVQCGKESDDRGTMHYKQILAMYNSEPVVFQHNVLAININKSIEKRENIYEAVRYAWRLNPENAKKAELILAIQHGIVIGVFQAKCWHEATTKNFPGTSEDRKGRWGFTGHHAPKEIAKLYLDKRVPPSSQNPVRYFGPSSPSPE